MPHTTWVIPPPEKTLVVGVAEMVASNDPGAELVTYSLGSCLGVTIYDPAKKVGGLLHLMLPDSSIDGAKAMTVPFMFVDTGVPRLFQAVYSLGGDRRRLIIKVAGGAQFLDPKGVFNIGERNYAALTGLLGRNGCTLHAQDVGGVRSRTLRMELSSGRITIRCPGSEPYTL
ncbi:MAG: chemotaxis protein CheD [Verrucomicrobiota bacterium]|jgi:chemotaxis protein CheD